MIKKKTKKIYIQLEKEHDQWQCTPTILFFGCEEHASISTKAMTAEIKNPAIPNPPRPLLSSHSS